MDLTTRGSFRLFRVAGITVFLHWLWFPVAIIEIAASRPVDYSQPAWKVVEYLSLFAIVLMHEFGHALACRSVGGQANDIVLWPLGGIAFVAPPARPVAVLWSIVAGPLVNLVLVIPTGIFWYCTGGQGLTAAGTDIDLLARNLFLLNALLLVFNMLPIYPLDGGQILQALLWFSLGRWQSLQVASLAGIVFGGALFLLILVLSAVHDLGLSGAILGIIPLFAVLRCVVGFQQARAALYLLNLPRHHECACPSCHMNPPRGAFWVCNEHCQTRFDLFDTHGRCPGCGAWYLKPNCPHCGRVNHIDRWFNPCAEGAEEELDPAALPAPEADASGSTPA